MAEPCQQEIVEFWWDALHEHNISPPGMTSYGRDEANAIFMVLPLRSFFVMRSA